MILRARVLSDKILDSCKRHDRLDKIGSNTLLTMPRAKDEWLANRTGVLRKEYGLGSEGTHKASAVQSESLEASLGSYDGG